MREIKRELKIVKMNGLFQRGLVRNCYESVGIFKNLIILKTNLSRKSETWVEVFSDIVDSSLFKS